MSSSTQITSSLRLPTITPSIKRIIIIIIVVDIVAIVWRVSFAIKWMVSNHLSHFSKPFHHEFVMGHWKQPNCEFFINEEKNEGKMGALATKLSFPNWFTLYRSVFYSFIQKACKIELILPFGVWFHKKKIPWLDSHFRNSTAFRTTNEKAPPLFFSQSSGINSQHRYWLCIKTPLVLPSDTFNVFAVSIRTLLFNCPNERFGKGNQHYQCVIGKCYRLDSLCSTFFSLFDSGAI